MGVLSVSNLTRNVNEDHLQEIFGLYGKVKETTVAVDKNVGLPKGYAYVEFSSEREAEKAIEGLHGGRLTGTPSRLSFRVTRRREPMTKTDALVPRLQYEGLLQGLATEIGIARRSETVEAGV